METTTAIFALCCGCGDAVEGEALACPWCGFALDYIAASAQGAERLESLWLDGHLDDVTFERVAVAIAEARAEAQAEADARALAGGRYPRLKLGPVRWRQAAAFVDAFHRHHWSPVGWSFGQGAFDAAGELVGVVIVGRPVARMIATRQPDVLEVTRLCVLPGYPNAGSMLLGFARRAARKLGARKLISYLLAGEGGACYRAAGWALEAASRGGSWHRRGRPRLDKAPTGRKTRWAVAC